MTDDLSANLSMPLLMPAQAQKHVTHNEALLVLDALVQLVVEDRSLPLAPGGAVAGQRHIVPAGAGALWGGPDHAVAVFDGIAWQFHPPRPGWRAYVLAEAAELVWQDGAWQGPETRALAAPRLGVNAAPDAVNRLAVASEAVLLNHDGAGHRLTINKAGPAETASLLFQTGFSGRAEMGTAGSDDFAVKVSADGSLWTEALRAEAATGRLVAPQGMLLNGALTGLAVTQSQIDATVGRLMLVGAFGLGVTTSSPQCPDLDATTLASGTYNVVSTTPNVGSRPMGSNQFATMRVERYSVDRCWQEYFDRADSGGNGIRKWIRGYSPTTGWSVWQRDYTANSIVGTVSQSGGVPTGAVIERGSNANGEYVRFADGTQICTRKQAASRAISNGIMGGFRSGAENWSYPAIFASAPVVNVTVENLTGFGGMLVSPPTASTAQWAVTAIASQADASREVSLFAIGRWF